YFDPLVLARAATRTAAVWAAAGATDEALEHAWTADRAALRIADLWDRCAILSELARTDRALGDAATAQAYAEAVDALTRAVAAPALLAGLQSTAAEAWLAAGMPDRAEEAVMALAAAVPAGQEGADGQPGDAESDERSRAELVELFLDAGELDRAARVAAAFPCPDGDAGAREPLARAWLAAGELDRAAEVVQPHTAAAVALVRAYAAAGDGATAGALAERIESAARAVTNESIDPGKNPWADAMVWSVRAWAAAGETERAAGLARTVEQTVLDRTVRSPLARMPLFHALVKAGELDEAEEVGAAFPDACDRVQALTDLARVRVTGGDLPRARGHAEAAESLVQAMCEPGDEASAPPSEFSLNHARSRVVEAFSALGDLDHARMLADGITDEHALASARTSIALRLIADGDLEAAEAVLAELADVYRDRHLPELMDAWAAAGDPGRARMIGEAAAGPALRSPYGNWLVRQAMAEGDEPRAQALAERMEAAARTVDLSDRADALRSVCSAWLTLGDLARAEAVADTVPSTALQIAARCEVALAYQDQGDETAARRRLTAVGAGERDARDNPELHEWSVERLAAAWAALGDFEQALAVAESARWPQQRASAIASLARLATPPRSRRLLCRALAVHIDYREIIYTVVALAPEAVAAVAAVRDL
ncbi:MAG: hypothetical protein HOY79_13845, partial [Streptomyces sp.]|nr:hypothetical protein [Streptomyces sp.]